MVLPSDMITQRPSFLTASPFPLLSLTFHFAHFTNHLHPEHSHAYSHSHHSSHSYSPSHHSPPCRSSNTDPKTQTACPTAKSHPKHQNPSNTSAAVRPYTTSIPSAAFRSLSRPSLTTVSLDCGAKTPVKPSETIRCKECGHRVMYKPRTHRSEFVPSIALSCRCR